MYNKYMRKDKNNKYTSKKYSNIIPKGLSAKKGGLLMIQ